ncbi:MAG: thiamine phosphate synthase [Candidatus Omnitrophota bacterium]
MKKKSLVQSKLYCILDYAALDGRNIVSAAENVISGGADIIQLRFNPAYRSGRIMELSKVLEDACRIARLAKRFNVIFIINDRLDVALLVNADGVHLGQDDIPYAYARKLLGREKIIGLSTHSLKQAFFAEKLGSDYISVGPVFATPTKPEYKAVGLSLIRKVKNKIRIPFVAIGGINPNNLSDVLGAGADRVAVVRAVCRAKNIQNAVRNLKGKLNKK